MTKATTPSGSLDEAVAFRQGVSVVTIKDQLTGMLPKFSAGTRSRIVIDGNAPDSDIYYDDSMIGLGPGTIVPTPAETFPVFLYDHDFNKFEEVYDISEPGIFDLKVSGSYTGELDATFRIQIANPDDDDVYTISAPIYNPVDPNANGLNDLSVVFQDITETNDEGEETLLVASGSYDMSQGIAVYKVEIASAEEGAVDTIRWYKNGELLTPEGADEVITANNGNELIDGNSKIVVKFEYDGFEDVRFGAEAKHTVGDSWTIVAGTQQIRWSKGKFNDSDGATLETAEGESQGFGTPTGIIQEDWQALADGLYIKLPAQIGYPDGSDPNVEPVLWEFKVTSVKPEAAITAMQESAGKIQIYPDHRTEQRDFGQPKFHNDFDNAIVDQQQVSTIEVLRINEIGQQNPSWPVILDPTALPRTVQGNTLLYSSAVHNKKNLSYEEANAYDESIGIPIEANLDPLQRTWVRSSVSHDGSVGPYFTIQDLRGENKKPRNNHFWFNFGYTTTDDITLYDDKNPSPKISDPVEIDISGRDLSSIEFINQANHSRAGEYEVHNVSAIHNMPYDDISSGESYWSNDSGVTMVSAADVHPDGAGAVWPTSINASGNKLYYLAASSSTTYRIAETAGWNPDLVVAAPYKMSTDINGNILLNSLGVPTPLEQEQWMEYHGYEVASIGEIDWMIKEGYIAYENALHNKYFTIYDPSFQGYYVQFNVIDNLGAVPLNDVENDGTLNNTETAWMIDTDADGIPDKKKSKSNLRLIRVDLNRYDTATHVSEKLALRLNKDLPAPLLDSSHPFYSGVNVSAILSVTQSESSPHISNIEFLSKGKIQSSDYDLYDATDATNYENFQVYLAEEGSLGYVQNVLLSDESTVANVGNCICMYNVSEYQYEDSSGVVIVVPASSPHAVWFNLDGTSLPPIPNPSDPADPMFDPLKEIIGLWSYSFNDDYAADIKDAFDLGRTIELLIYPDTPARTISYMVNQSIQNSMFITPFIPLTESGSNQVRIMQRDPGPVVTASTSIPDQTCHDVNCDISTSIIREGRQISPENRDRDYIADSIVFAISDSPVISERFSAKKRVVENYGHFRINCVAEEKSGTLFDYTNQEWTDPDPDVVGFPLAQILKGGKSELSNYEPNLVELFDNVPQKKILSDNVWKRPSSTVFETVAEDAGFNPALPNYDSKNRILWGDNIDPSLRTVVTTAQALGLQDDEMDPAVWFNFDSAGWIDITESEWMTNEGYIPVPAFIHKISQAAYFLLPHPERNFYVWFDVGQLSADPGDDGQLDNDININIEGDIDRTFIGGGVRISLDSYDTAGTVAQKIVDRINSDRYDVHKKFVQVNVDDTGNPEYQALVSGNINSYFEASISEDDSSIVNIMCKKPGLISTTVFEKNNLINFPATSSGDLFSIDLVDDGDTDFYVDVINTVPGFVIAPTTDVVRPDADTNLQVTVSEKPYSPTQPGLTKVVSKFLPYEDMNSINRGYRKTLEDGTEVAVAGPVAFIEDDIGSLIYPVIMSNVSMKDPDQYDGVIEPLEIRSRASRNSPDAYFVAHDVKGDLQSDVASDSRKRSNPITQFINKTITKFEPYEDGIEHMESSPSVDAYIQTPVFNGVGINDLFIGGVYSEIAGSPPASYDIQCVTAYDELSSLNDRFRWRKNQGDWSDTVELLDTDIGSKTIITFENIRTSSIPEVKSLPVPNGSYGYTIDIHVQGDINSATEFYTIQYLDESAGWQDITQLNDLSHPLYTPTPTPGTGYTPGRYGYSSIPHESIIYDSAAGLPETLPLMLNGTLQLRVLPSPDVNNLLGVKNSVKIVTTFNRLSGYLELDNGIYCVFDNKNGHTSGDEWTFNAVSKTNHDVGYLPFPGYLTWQESRIDPFIETTDPEEATNDISDNLDLKTSATATMAFNYDGYSAAIPLTNTTWETEYLKSLNGQAFTLTDSSGAQKRFEFDNDNVLENDGEVLVPLLRNESLFIRFPDSENSFQRRDASGNLLWLDFLDPPNSFAAYTGAPNEAASYLSDDGVTSLVNYDHTDGSGTELFSGMTEVEWAQHYRLTPDMVEPAEICSTLQNVSQYAGQYFIITDEVDSSRENINNTVSGGRYAVWFNIVDKDTLEPIAGSTAPTFAGGNIQEEVILYWHVATSSWDTAANIGYPEAGYEDEDELTWSVRTGYYSTRSVRSPKWSNDSGKTILCAFNIVDGVNGTGWSPDPSTNKMGTSTSGDELWSNDGGMTITEYAPAAPVPSGYERIYLNEAEWHEYEGFELYSGLIPQLIEVTVNSTDAINILAKKTVKAINSFKNANQTKVFNARYIHPPEYTDLYDLDPADAEDAAEIALAGGTWVPADYDNILHVKLESDWFNQYALDPGSPPNLASLQNNWLRGFISIKVSSRNSGYHNISSRLAGTATTPASHEPLYHSFVPTGSVREFMIENNESSDWGGYHTFKDVLEITSKKINDSSLDISGEVIYSDSLSQLSIAGVQQYIDPVSTIESGIILTNVPGDSYDVFSSNELIADNFVRYKNSIDESSREYVYKDYLCGILLTQGIPGPTGNTIPKFHHYEENKKGNILFSNFTGGTSSGPHIDNTLISMHPGDTDMRPHDHISSTAGMIYNDMPCGTDSITFGGWKK